MSTKRSINRLVDVGIARNTFGNGQNYDPIAPARINAGQPGTGDGTTTDGGNATANGTDHNGETITDNVQPDTTGGTTTNGSQDALAVIDGTAGPQVSDSSGAGETSDFASTDDGVNASQGSTGFSVDKLTGVTGLTDCATGLGVNFRLDGKYVPPAGWVDADTPPITPTTDVVPICLNMNCPASNTPGSEGATVWYSGSGTLWKIMYVTAADGTDTTPGGWAFTNNCTNCQVDSNSSYFPVLLRSDASYTDPPPLSSSWPIDGNYDLAIIDGKIISNQYDSEAPASAAAGMTSVELCAAGGRKVKVEPAIDGGTMMYEVDPISSAGIGIVRVYNKDGSLRAVGDHSTQFVQSNLPK